MPTSFQNMATLTYTGGTVNSNIVTGELREVLTAAKTAVRENYEPGGTVTYVVSLTNSGITPLTGLTISDNLCGYTFGGATLYPLAYLPGSVRYYVNGALQAAPVVNAGPPMTVTGITVPAGGSALVIYETEVTRYAPLAAESSVVNTVTVTGGGLAAPVTAEETVGVVSSPRLSITKGLNPTVVAENGRITYTFTIQNTGNTPVTATDDVILRDTFDPVLNGLTVTYNGAPWTAGTQYTYDGTTGLFATTAADHRSRSNVYAGPGDRGVDCDPRRQRTDRHRHGVSTGQGQKGGRRPSFLHRVRQKND